MKMNTTALRKLSLIYHHTYQLYSNHNLIAKLKMLTLTLIMNVLKIDKD